MTITPPLYPLALFGGEAPPAPAWFLAAVANAPQRASLEVEGAAIDAISWGRVGDPGVLLLHGAMAHAEWWSHVAPLLAKGRRVTAMSFSGMGRSSWRDAYDIDQHAREALAAAEHTGLFESEQAPTIVAHSFGGHILLRLAAEAGDRFERGVVVDTLMPASSRMPRQAVAPDAYASVVEALLRFRLIPGQAADPFVLDLLARRGLMRVPGPDGDVYAWRFDPRYFLKVAPFQDDSALKRVACKLIFIRGGASAICTPPSRRSSARRPRLARGF